MLKFTFNKIVISLLIGTMLYLVTSCNTFDPDTSTPAYLSVDSVTFSDGQNQGAPTSNITNVWAYYNNNPIGVYDVPALFPILTVGRTLIQLSPGIEDNGLQETRVIYPFYTYDTTTINFQIGQTSSYIPHFTYRPNTQFSFITDFEFGNNFHTFDGSDTTMIRLTASPEVKYGKYCGLIALDTKHPLYQGETILAYTLPTSSAVYVEMDYMCNIPFNIGLTGITSGDTVPNYFEQVNPISYWHKIYFDLTPYIASAGADQYQIAINVSLPPGVSSGQVYLDNIKLVHF